MTEIRKSPSGQLQEVVGSISAGAGITLNIVGDDTEIINDLSSVRSFTIGTDFNSTLGAYRTRSLGATGAHQFTFSFPTNMTSLTSVEMLAIAGSAGGGIGVDIDFLSEYGPLGGQSDANTVNIAAGTFNIPAAGTLFSFDLLDVDGLGSLFPAAAGGDMAGVEVDHMGIGGIIEYLGIRIGYVV